MHPYKILWIFFTTILLAGCGTTPVTHFYMLTALEQTGTGSMLPASEQRHIGIGPVRLPKYLDRPHIVTRTADAEIYLSETHRWAEPLQDNFTRVLAENLSRLLGTDQVSIEPSANRALVDYRISVDVAQFDSGSNGEVILIANWSILDRDGGRLAATRRSEIRLAVRQTAGYAEIVSVLSYAVSGLSREISESISNLPAAAGSAE